MKKATLAQNNRIVIPKPFCEELNIIEGSPLNITLEDGAVVVRPDPTTCRLCGSLIESDRTLLLCDQCMEEAWKYHISNQRKD